MVIEQNQKQVSEAKYLTAKETANYIGVSVNYLYKLTSGHKIPFYNPTPRKLIFKRSDLDEWIERSRVATIDELESIAETTIARKGGVL